MTLQLDFTVNQMIAVERSQLGVKESPRNTNRQKYGAWYGWNGVSWCGIGQCWSFAHAPNGIDLRKHGFSSPASTVAFLRDGKNIWRAVSANNIRPGDLVFYDFPDNVHRTQHVGLAVTSVSRGKFKAIEFNTSAGSNTNGGEVQLRDRTVSFVSGVVRPLYQPVTSLPGKKPTQKTLPIYTSLASRKNFQKSVGLTGSAVDGKIGPKTLAAANALELKFRNQSGNKALFSQMRSLKRAMSPILGLVPNIGWGPKSHATYVKYLAANRIK